MSKKRAENYLDFVPVPNPRNTWSEEGGIVTIHMVHRGIYDRLAQKLFHTPPVSHIQLAEALREEYGEAAEPLYDRLVHYMQILRNNRFVLIRGKDKVKP